MKVRLSLCILMICALSACGRELHAPPGVNLCRIERPPDLGPPAKPVCETCVNTLCHGIELPGCSTCSGDRACMTTPIGSAGEGCCDNRPPPDPDGDLPVCQPGIGGSPKLY